ncbi:MAG TPA: tetratricopeptide repeat protein [Bryobacteraceae bacterium]|nr:tetratricopeptide repeat protein [Bryobacteraceae bacterium]
MRAIVLLLFVAFAASAQPVSQSGFDRLAAKASEALQSNPGRAAGLYKEALEIRPAWAEGWFYLGASQYQLKLFREARVSFQRAGELAPDNGAVWGFLGLTEDSLGAHEPALENIRRGEKVGLPDDRQFVCAVRLHAAKIYIARADFTAAVDQLRPLAQSGNREPEFIETLGRAVLEMPVFPSSNPRPGETQLLELAGRVAAAMYGQGPADARSDLEQLLTRYPNQPGVNYLAGLTLLQVEPSAALNHFQQELQIRPLHVPSLLQIAILKLRAGEFTVAANLAATALKHQPENPLAKLVMARALMDLHRAPEAIPYLEQASRSIPENRQVHYFLERAYRASGRAADADKQKAEFLKLKAAAVDKSPAQLMDPSASLPE